MSQGTLSILIAVAGLVLAGIAAVFAGLQVRRRKVRREISAFPILNDEFNQPDEVQILFRGRVVKDPWAVHMTLTSISRQDVTAHEFGSSSFDIDFGALIISSQIEGHSDEITHVPKLEDTTVLTVTPGHLVRHKPWRFTVVCDGKPGKIEMPDLIDTDWVTSSKRTLRDRRISLIILFAVVALWTSLWTLNTDVRLTLLAGVSVALFAGLTFWSKSNP